MLDAIAPPLLVAVAVQVISQLFKVALYSVRERRFAPEYFVTAGGFPSAHAAFVSALTASVAVRAGIGSDLFAVSFVFSAIVIYDAYRLRGHVQDHARRLNRLADLLERASAHIEEMRRDRIAAEPSTERGAAPALTPPSEPPVSEMVGHSLGEIIVGVAFGVIVAVVVVSLL